MAKLKLVAEPTFKAKVGIPVIGADPVQVEMTFKHRTRTALQEWLKSRDGKTEVEVFMDFVQGWDLEDAFNKENALLLVENYHGAALVALQAYVEQLSQAKLGN